MKKNVVKISLIILGLFLSSELWAQSNQIIELVKEQHQLHVKKSCNEYNCFTNVDLGNFRNSNTPEHVTSRLAEDAYFKKLMDEAKSLSDTAKSELIAQIKDTYTPSWAELGGISCKGQTDAGQMAQKEISFAIARLVREMIY